MEPIVSQEQMEERQAPEKQALQKARRRSLLLISFALGITALGAVLLFVLRVLFYIHY